MGCCLKQGTSKSNSRVYPYFKNMFQLTKMTVLWIHPIFRHTHSFIIILVFPSHPMFVGKSRLVGCVPINSPMKSPVYQCIFSEVSPKIPDLAQNLPVYPLSPCFFHRFPMDLTIFLHISSSFHCPLGFTRPHIQDARLGTEGTKGEAQATLKLHCAIDLG